MRLALDAMGGDHAPAAMAEGAIDFARKHPEHHLLLVGREYAVRGALGEEGRDFGNLEVIDAPEEIGMGDKITALRERPDNSIRKCVELVRDRQAEGVVLCGNTSCSVAAAQFHIGRIPGVKRAGILTPLPTVVGTTWVIDCGANTIGKPEHLACFAEMATVFLRDYCKVASPKVGVLNIGEEDSKGHDLTADTLELLRGGDLRVIGYVEGNDIYKGTVDIVVCDGFTGNVVLKTSEGVCSAMGKMLRQELCRGLLSRIGAVFARAAFRRLRQRVDWAEVGGCLLLGVDGIAVIGHGRSDRVAVRNALAQAARCGETGVLDHLRQHCRTTDAA